MSRTFSAALPPPAPMSETSARHRGTGRGGRGRGSECRHCGPRSGRRLRQGRPVTIRPVRHGFRGDRWSRAGLLRARQCAIPPLEDGVTHFPLFTACRVPPGAHGSSDKLPSKEVRNSEIRHSASPKPIWAEPTGWSRPPGNGVRTPETRQLTSPKPIWAEPIDISSRPSIASSGASRESC